MAQEQSMEDFRVVSKVLGVHLRLLRAVQAAPAQQRFHLKSEPDEQPML